MLPAKTLLLELVAAACPLLAAGLLLFSLSAQAQSPATAQDKNRIKEGNPTPQPPLRIVCTQMPLAADQPLYVLNGTPMISSFTLEDVPADRIKEVRILKDASATALYGARGANGVVLITTKRRWKPATS